MADILHSTIRDEYLHQPKGAATATAGTWMRANGDGTTSFTTLPTSSLNVVDSLTSLSAASQQLAKKGDEAQVTFGTPETSSGGSVSIATNGAVTVNKTGVYDLSIQRNPTRTGSSGVNSVAFSLRKNGTQIGRTSLVSLDGVGYGTGSDTSGIISLTAGDQLTHHMFFQAGTSDTIGIDTTPISKAGWDAVPSAQITISKLEVQYENGTS